MKSTLEKETWESIEQKIEEARDLIDKRKELRERLGNVERQRDTVNAKIYAKVKADYEEEFNRLEKVIIPLETKAAGIREDISSEIKELDSVLGPLRDSIAEIEFRHTVGEFDKNALAGRRDPMKEEFQKKSSRKKELLEAFEKIDVLFDAFRDSGGVSTVTDSREQDKKKPDNTFTTESSDFVGGFPKGPFDEKSSGGCKDSIEELSIRDSKENKPFSDGNVEDDDDPLADLADPMVDDSPDDSRTKREAEQAAGGTSPAPEGMPMITVNGPGPLRRIPVLPMTMTIGREHDNNIEIKDEEVSRYHARISHKSGKYLLKALENSSGVWVNGRKTEEAELQNADKIKIGKTDMVFSWK